MSELCEVYRGEGFAAFYKPKGIPTAPLKFSRDGKSLLEQVIARYPAVSSVRGYSDWEPGLLHRLDTATSGLVLIAVDNDAFERLSSFQDRDLMTKTYTARVLRKMPDASFPPLDEELLGALAGGIPVRRFAVESAFRAWGVGRQAVRPCSPSSRKGSSRVYRTIICRGPEADTAVCTITRGFRHQIRCHLAWIGFPIAGDGLYGGSDGPLELECTKITFPRTEITLSPTLTDN
ncbi:MAG: RNA pseudouridine synthase [Spirochaetales bacterium]|nr:RNA pseudouridine synthase [Spirochaetales bacterium]